ALNIRPAGPQRGVWPAAPRNGRARTGLTRGTRPGAVVPSLLGTVPDGRFRRRAEGPLAGSRYSQASFAQTLSRRVRRTARPDRRRADSVPGRRMLGTPRRLTALGCAMALLEPGLGAAATHPLEAIRYEMDDRSLLALERTASGIRAERAPLPYLTEVKGVARRIERGLREDATGSGVPPRVVSELADIFSWELDLESDLRPGDEFRVLYENTRQAAEAVAVTVIAAEIIAGGRELTAVFF